MRHKDAPRTALGGFLSRFYGCTMCLGPITMLTVVGYSYFIAATVSSCTAVSAFLIAPRISRLMDRKGQSKVIPPAMLVALIGLAGLLANTALAGAFWIDYPFAVLMGLAPNIQSITRSRWVHLLENEDSSLIKVAFSFEGVLDDIAFMIGPAVVIMFSTLWFPEAGPLFGGIAFLLGLTILLSCKQTEPVPVPDAGRHGSSADKDMLRSSPMVRLLFASLFLMGLFYGALDPATLAICGELSTTSVSSIVFAISSFVSIFSGFLFGTIQIQASLKKQLLVCSALLGIFYAAMVFIDSIPKLIIISAIAAIAYAPFYISVNSCCARCVPQERMTESLTWISMGMTFGLAFGPLGAGYLISNVSVHAGFVMCAVCALAIPVLLLANMRTLTRELDKPRKTTLDLDVPGEDD